MSFSADTKNEISREVNKKKCCNIAEIAGLIKSCGSITLAGKGNVGLLLTTENPAVARHIKTILSEQFSVKASLRVVNPTFRRNKHVYELTIPHEKGAENILHVTGILSEIDGITEIRDSFSESIMKKKCCRKACLKGLFLGSGSITDPEKDYNFEITFTKEAASNATKKLINSFVDIYAKVKKRRDNYVVYIRNSEQIKDILNIIGAHSHLLKYENVRVMKNMRNKTNRINNFDNANFDRVINASDKQLEEILYIRSTVGLDELPKRLLDTALARMNHPEASYSELGEMMSPQVKKSTIQGRLKNISEFAENLQKTN